MIYGIGCDIVDIHRFEKYVDDKKRLEKLYTESELNEFYKITNHTLRCKGGYFKSFRGWDFQRFFFS